MCSGGGPVGASALALVGNAGIHASGIERDPVLWPQARAVHFDGETLRTFLAISLGEPVFALGKPMVRGPGRHLAGDNTFTYFDDPNGSTMEYTTELKALYDTSRRDASDQWGTSNPVNEWASKQTFNDPDKGAFTAPPVWSPRSSRSG